MKKSYTKCIKTVKKENSMVRLSSNNSVQVVHTHVPLSPSSMICYRSRGSSAIQLGR